MALGLLFAWSAVFSLPAQADFAEGLAAYDGGDYAAALRTWRALAEAGHLEAQVALASLYMNGEGVPPDRAAALHWYARAGQAGHPVAQLNLGDIYNRGLGVPRDVVAAYVWFSLAAAQGRAWAAAQRDTLAREMTPAQRAEAEDKIAARRR